MVNKNKIMVGGSFYGFPAISITNIHEDCTRAEAESLAIYKFLGSPDELSHIVGIEPDLIKDKTKWTYFECGDTKYLIEAEASPLDCQLALNLQYRFHELPTDFITKFESTRYLKQKSN